MTSGPSEGADPGDDSPAGPPADPFSQIFGGLDPQDIGAAFARIGQLLSWQGGPVNWDLAQQVARQTISQSGDRSVGDADRRAIADAVRLADHWLDGATTLPAAAPEGKAWSRAEWFEATLPVWRALVEPVAAHVVEAIGGALPDEAAHLSGPMLGMMRQVGGAMFGAQVGQALGSLAAEVVGSADIGLPLTAAAHAALLPANVAEFGSGLGVGADDVRLYLALREAAYVRLFAHVPWLAPRLVGAVEEYGRGITIDTSRLEEAVRDIDPGRPEALQEIFAEGMFQPSVTPAQQAALARIETLLALVEGWVDAVVTAATTDRLPSAPSLQEAIRRRRAAGGPAEQTFATLVGLELRPRRLRDAARLWSLLTDQRGVDGRDAVWHHPDLLPDASDLDDPEGFVTSTQVGLDLTSLHDHPAAADDNDDVSDDSAADDGDEPAGPAGR
jgi:putative hydrolase